MKQLLNLSPVLMASIFSVCLIFISCHDDNNDPKEPSKPLLATMKVYSQDGQMHESEVYRYDSNRRLVEVKTDDKYKTTFEYSASSVTVKSYYKDSLDETQILHLDNKGLCKSTIWEDDYSSDFTYDANGYRKTSVETSGNSTITQTYTVSQENYVTITWQDATVNPGSAKVLRPDLFGKLALLKIHQGTSINQNRLKSASDQISISKTDYEFYTDQVNTIDIENMGIYFFGKQNKNPIKLETETFGDWPAHTSNYSYEYDGKGRITKKNYDDGGYDVFTYVE